MKIQFDIGNIYTNVDSNEMKLKTSNITNTRCVLYSKEVVRCKSKQFGQIINKIKLIYICYNKTKVMNETNATIAYISPIIHLSMC